MTINNKMYQSFIESTIRNEGTKVADTANKLALAQQRITVKQYLEAAKRIVKAEYGA